MSGNVFEWVWDRYELGNGRYPSGELTDFTGPASDTFRVPRGGSWNGVYASNCAVAYRDAGAPNARDYGLGFRVLLPAQ
jgi:formylglycine-generating enzyme required for sulfatase activity